MSFFDSLVKGRRKNLKIHNIKNMSGDWIKQKDFGF